MVQFTDTGHKLYQLTDGQLARMNELIQGGAIVIKLAIAPITLQTCELHLEFKDSKENHRKEILC